MQKILVTSLRSEFDLMACSEMIGGLHEQHPHSEIHLLTYSKFSNAAALVNHVAQVHTISVDKIQQIFNGAIYHNGFAINIFLQELHTVLQTSWNKVINYSNDEVSAYLISALNTEQVIGTSISMTGSPLTCNIYNDYLNNIATQLTRQPIHLEEVKRLMCSVGEAAAPITINSEHKLVAAQNFEKIRKSKNVEDTVIVAISMAPSYDGQQLDFDSCEQLIEAMEQSENFKPVLLLNNTPEQKSFVNQLNAKFNNKLISICAHTEAMPGILANIDILVSNTNLHLYMADVMNVRSVEITTSTCGPRLTHTGSYSVVADDRTFYNEVCYLLNISFQTALPVETNSLPNKVYQAEQDQHGIYYTQIQGPVDLHQELTYHLSRSYCHELLGATRNDELINNLASHCSEAEVSSYFNEIKSHITDCSKHLLATLRNLKSISSSKESRSQFIEHLDKLMTAAQECPLTHIPVLMFEANIKAITTADMEQSLKQTEACLYSLKNNLQKLSATIELLGKKSSNTSVTATV